MNEMLNAQLAKSGSEMRARAPWTVEEVEALFDLSFSDLIFRAQGVHRTHFDPNEVQVSTLLSIKTGGCSEDCGYCSQSKRHHTEVEQENLLDLESVVEKAKAAKDKGATRFCMGAAWRGPKQKDLKPVLDMITAVRALGLETCVTLGMLKEGQAEQLRVAGLDYYNHNLDTAPEYYGEVITTHTYQDRLDTLGEVRQAGIKVCSGGIVGMGETRTHRAALIASSPTSIRRRRLFRSTCWCRCRVRHCKTLRRSTRSNLCVPSRWRASPCQKAWCAFPPGGSRWRNRSKRCASWPAPIPFSTARNC